MMICLFKLISRCENRRLDINNPMYERYIKAYTEDGYINSSLSYSYVGIKLMFPSKTKFLLGSDFDDRITPEGFFGSGDTFKWIKDLKSTLIFDNKFDSLCIFRVVVAELKLLDNNNIIKTDSQISQRIKKDVNKLANEYFKTNPDRPNGLSVYDVSHRLANFVKANIHVYQANENQLIKKVYSDKNINEDWPTINIGVTKTGKNGHAFLIRDLKGFISDTQCKGCGHVSPSLDSLKKHKCLEGKSLIKAMEYRFMLDESIFYGISNYSEIACKWIEKQSKKQVNIFIMLYAVILEKGLLKKDLLMVTNQLQILYTNFMDVSFMGMIVKIVFMTKIS